MPAEIGGAGESPAGGRQHHPLTRRWAIGAAALAALTPTTLAATTAEAATVNTPTTRTPPASAAGGPATDWGTPGPGGGLIDVHHHAMPPQVRAWLVQHGQLPPVGGPPFANWSLPATLDTMGRVGIGTALLSAAIPSEFTPTPPLAAELARLANDTTAALVRDNPTRFGLLASIPRPTPAIAIAEIRHAYDTLHADGILLMAHDGVTYLGDPTLAPMMAELNARDAVVLIHPFNLPGATPVAIPPFAADFLADTTRAALQLIVSGSLDRYPRIRWILAHGGGYLPYQAARLILGHGLGYGVDAATVEGALRRFHVDTAAPMSPYSTPTLLATIGTERILYGSDYNAIPADTALATRDALRTDPALDAVARRRIGRDNALRLFPTLAARLQPPHR